MAKVEIDKSICIGCGACMATCPDVFEMDEDGLAKVKKDEVNDDVKLACDCCPVGAIKINEEK